MLVQSGRTEIESSKAWIRHFSDSVIDPKNHQQELDSAREALTLAKQFNEFDPRYSESLRRISQIHIRNKDLAAAEPFLLQELKVLKKFGPGFPDLDYDLFWLAVTNERRGKISEAKRMFKEALAIARTLRKNAEPEVFHIYGDLAALCLYENNPKEAAQYRQNAVDYVFATALRDEQIYSGTLSLRMNLEAERFSLTSINPKLAWAFLETIIECAQAAVDKQAATRGVNSLVYCDLLMELAYMKSYLLDDEESIELFQRALKFLQSKYPYDKRRIGRCAAHLSNAFTGLNRDREAIAYLKLAFDNFENFDESSEYKYEWVASPTKYLGNLLSKRGNVPERIRIYERLLGLGTDLPARYKARKLLAEAYRQFGDGEYAEKRFGQAVQAYEKSVQHYRQCAPNSLECFETLDQLGHTCMLMRQDRRAESYLDEVVYGLDASHRSFAYTTLKRRALFDLSLIARRAGRQPSPEYTDAKVNGDALYQQVIADLERDRTTGAGNASEVRKADRKLWQTYLGHAKTLAREGRLAEAVRAFEKGLPSYINVVGSNVVYYRLLLEYVDWLLVLKRYDEAESVVLNIIAGGRSSSGLEFPKYIHFAVEDLKQIYKATSRPAQEKAISNDDQIRVFQETTLAFRYMDNGCYANASRLFNKILEEDVAVFGAKSNIVMMDLDRAAHYSFLTENYDDAERYCNRYLESFFKPNDRTCNVMNLLGCIYNRTGRHVQAEEFLRDKLSRDMFKHEYLGGRVMTYYTLAVALYLQNRPDQAARQLETARKSSKSPLLILTDAKLPLVLSPLRARHFDLEIRILDEELKLSRELRSDNNAAVILLYAELGNCYAAKKQFQTANEMFEEALHLKKVSSNRDKNLELQILIPYEASLRSEGRIQQAQKIADKVRVIKEKCK